MNDFCNCLACLFLINQKYYKIEYPSQQQMKIIKPQRDMTKLQYLKIIKLLNKHYNVKEYIFCITSEYEYQQINIYRFVYVTIEMVQETGEKKMSIFPRRQCVFHSIHKY